MKRLVRARVRFICTSLAHSDHSQCVVQVSQSVRDRTIQYTNLETCCGFNSSELVSDYFILLIAISRGGDSFVVI